MQEMVAGIRRVTDTMGEISAASSQAAAPKTVAPATQARNSGGEWETF